MASKLKGLGTTALFTILFSLQSAWAAERVFAELSGFQPVYCGSGPGYSGRVGGDFPIAWPVYWIWRGQRPEELRSLLTHSIETNPRILDRALNSYPGEWVLDQLGEAIHPPAGQASRQALRSAIVLSATDDGELTLLEILENYPTPEVVLEGDNIQQAYNRLQGFLNTLSIFY